MSLGESPLGVIPLGAGLPVTGGGTTDFTSAWTSAFSNTATINKLNYLAASIAAALSNTANIEAALEFSGSVNGVLVNSATIAKIADLAASISATAAYDSVLTLVSGFSGAFDAVAVTDAIMAKAIGLSGDVTSALVIDSDTLHKAIEFTANTTEAYVQSDAALSIESTTDFAGIVTAVMSINDAAMVKEAALQAVYTGQFNSAVNITVAKVLQATVASALATSGVLTGSESYFTGSVSSTLSIPDASINLSALLSGSIAGSINIDAGAIVKLAELSASADSTLTNTALIEVAKVITASFDGAYSHGGALLLTSEEHQFQPIVTRVYKDLKITKVGKVINITTTGG